MQTDVLVVLGAVLIASAIGAVVVWFASTTRRGASTAEQLDAQVGLRATGTESKADQLELSLSRIEREARIARELIRGSR